jgi:hypothetical protein
VQILYISTPLAAILMMLSLFFGQVMAGRAESDAEKVKWWRVAIFFSTGGAVIGIGGALI